MEGCNVPSSKKAMMLLDSKSNEWKFKRKFWDKHDSEQVIRADGYALVIQTSS